MDKGYSRRDFLGAALAAAALPMLAGAGYQNLADQYCGYDGTRRPDGTVDPGWAPRGLPTSAGADAERGYSALKAGGR